MHFRLPRIMSTIAASATLTLAAAASTFADDAAAGPRDGKYRILSYGATTSPPLHLGSFILSGNTYKAFLVGDKPTGEGQWKYDAATSTVTWLSGPYKDVWGGEFTIDREGKTHKIRLKRTTIAVNSTDAP